MTAAKWVIFTVLMIAIWTMPFVVPRLVIWFLRKRTTKPKASGQFLCTFCGTPDAAEPWTECAACQILGKYSKHQIAAILADYEHQIDVHMTELRRSKQ